MQAQAKNAQSSNIVLEFKHMNLTTCLIELNTTADVQEKLVEARELTDASARKN